MAGQNANRGSTGFWPGLIGIPYLPNIVSEWAALTPLVIHLASYQDDYHITGKIALLGRLPVSLFPAIGTYSGISRLLERGSEYLDFASSKGGSGRTVWDAKFGSVIPMANGAASAFVISALQRRRDPHITKISVPTNIGPLSAQSTETTLNSKSGANGNKVYRPQILNIYNFRRRQDQDHRGSGLRRAVNRLRISRASQIVLAIGLLGLCAFLAVFGVFGTAAIVLLCAMSKIIAQSITIHRPGLYLESLEDHDAAFLVAAHENAIEWHFLTGDHGIADTLLTKPMIVLPEGKNVAIASKWFQCAHAIQLTAMTFVAAQKGWDGVCLVVLVTVHYTLSWLFNPTTLASDWLERENVDVEVETFEFTGRFGLIGTIQLFSETKIDRWMDDILVPHPRRDLWLQMLRLPEGQAPTSLKDFSIRDQERVTRDVATAREGARCIRERLRSYRLGHTGTSFKGYA